MGGDGVVAGSHCCCCCCSARVDVGVGWPERNLFIFSSSHSRVFYSSDVGGVLKSSLAVEPILCTDSGWEVVSFEHTETEEGHFCWQKNQRGEVEWNGAWGTGPSSKFIIIVGVGCVEKYFLILFNSGILFPPSVYPGGGGGGGEVEVEEDEEKDEEERAVTNVMCLLQFRPPSFILVSLEVEEDFTLL